MKYAVATDGNAVSPHFGRCSAFTLIDCGESGVEKVTTVANPGHEPYYLPQYLYEMGVQVVVAGGMGRRAITSFQEKNIQVITGIDGTIDRVCSSIADGSLSGDEIPCRGGRNKKDGDEEETCPHHGGD